MGPSLYEHKSTNCLGIFHNIMIHGRFGPRIDVQTMRRPHFQANWVSRFLTPCWSPKSKHMSESTLRSKLSYERATPTERPSNIVCIWQLMPTFLRESTSLFLSVLRAPSTDFVIFLLAGNSDLCPLQKVYTLLWSETGGIARSPLGKNNIFSACVHTS